MTATHKLQQDARALPVSSCHPDSLDDYEVALPQLQSYFGDPAETLAVRLERGPEFVIGHVFNASAMLMMSERRYLPMIRDGIETAEALAYKLNDREKGLTSAARRWMEGRFRTRQNCIES